MDGLFHLAMWLFIIEKTIGLIILGFVLLVFGLVYLYLQYKKLVKKIKWK